MQLWLQDDLLSRKALVQRALIFSAVTLFVLFLFQPFGTHNDLMSYKYLRLSGYGLVTFCALLLSGVLEIRLTHLGLKNQFRWGFIPAALISSIIFGFGPIYQGHDVISAVMALAITAIAGTWFAWLYCECECGYRIWFPMFMPIFMNAAYGIFGMSGGAARDLEGNLFKATSIILSLVYVYLLVRQGKPREITLASLGQNKATLESQSQLTHQNAY